VVRRADKQCGIVVGVEVLLQCGVVGAGAVQVWWPCCCYSRHFQLLYFGFLQSLRLGTPVLEPDLHLQQEEKRMKRHSNCK
jgi:hypothetical protein